MPRIFDNIEVNLLPALRAALRDGNAGKAKSHISICSEALNHTIGRLTRMNKLVASPVRGLSP